MSETITQTQTRLEAFIKESYPLADTAPGSVLSELLIKLAASLQNDLNNTVELFSQQKAISDVLAATSPTVSPIIDEIASNYNVTRIEGSKSEGQLKITVASRRNYVVSSGVRFYQPNLNLYYVTTEDFKASLTPLSDESQLFTQNGIYYFILPVVAEDFGSATQIQSSTPFQLVSTSILSDFVSAEAYGNFTSGTDGEDDQTLITRYREGLNNKGLLSPASISAALKAKFPEVKAISVVGAGDAELLRSRKNIMGISTFGVADVYLRSSFGLQTSVITKEATKTAASTWSLNLDVNDVPGFYKLISIRPLGSTDLGSLAIVSQIFGYSVPSEQRVNLINDNADARFSIYQTCAVVFTYTETPGVAVDDTLDFEIVVSHQPLLSEIQDIFIGDDTRVACADYLVKAVLPCFVSLNIKVVKETASDDVEVSAIKQAIFNYVNSIPFGESLYASRIVDICHNFNIKRVDLPIQMTGLILANDGSITSLENSDLLTIPTDVSVGISPNTTMFFIDYQSDGTDNIGIEVV